VRVGAESQNVSLCGIKGPLIDPQHIDCGDPMLASEGGLVILASGLPKICILAFSLN
jgi:hypothetical protein